MNGATQHTTTCPVPGCDRTLAAWQLTCRPHWYALSIELRGRVWSTWRRRLENPSPERVAAHEAAKSEALAYLSRHVPGDSGQQSETQEHVTPPRSSTVHAEKAEPN